MDIKELIEAGVKLSYPYKHSKEDWVQVISINKAHTQDKIIIQSPTHEIEFKLDEIDAAIKKWKSIAFSKRNWWNKIVAERAKYSKFSEKWHEPPI